MRAADLRPVIERLLANFPAKVFPAGNFQGLSF